MLQDITSLDWDFL